MNQKQQEATTFRWTICTMLFFATTINYLDRQVLSLTWADFIAPEFHWTNNDYGTITGLFSIFYAIATLFTGKAVDWLDTKKGFMWAISIWSLGAILHAFCGIATSGIVTGDWLVGFEGAKEALMMTDNVAMLTSVSVTLFVISRCVLAIGESANFPVAIKATAEYFPKKERAFATSIFNSGATIGALLAPMTIPFIAKAYGWESAFIIIGALGFIWLFFWIFVYKKPYAHPKVNAAELAYINQDEDDIEPTTVVSEEDKKGLSILEAFKYRQTWSFIAGKFMTDGVWWFLLFWIPAYLKSVYHMDSTESAPYIFVIYAITMISIAGGYLPTIFIDKMGMEPYSGRMRAMLIFAFFPILALFAQPLGGISVWIPTIIIGIVGAAHQSWSANIYSTISDMFPKSAVATIIGIGTMAGGISSFMFNKGSGVLFDYAESSNISYFGFQGIEAGYFIVFTICSISYLVGWSIMKLLVPKFSPVKL